MSDSESKVGRPNTLNRKYTPVELVEKLASQGLTNDEMADVLGVHRDTFYEMQKNSKEFSDAVKRGKANPDRKVELALYNRAIGYTHPEEKIFCDKGDIVRAETFKHYPPDVLAGIFWLKNRRPDLWKDRQIVSHDVEEGVTKVNIEIKRTPENAENNSGD